MDDDYNLLATKNVKSGTNKLFEVISVLGHDAWNIDETVVPWISAEQKLLGFTDIFKYIIDVNDLRDFLKNIISNRENFAMPKSIE